MNNTYQIFQLYCENCHWKKITDGEDVIDLYEIKTSSLQTGLPKYDPIAKKTVDAQFRKQKRKFRCPSCGHAVLLKLIPDSQKAFEAKKELEARSEARKKLEESILRDQNRRSNVEENQTTGGEASVQGSEVS